MENQASVEAPQVQATAPTPAPTVQTTPAPTVETSYEQGGVSSFAITKLKLVDYFIVGLYLAVGIYGLMYFAEARKKLKEQPNADEFENMSGDIEEVKYNLKKALGKKYETT